MERASLTKSREEPSRSRSEEHTSELQSRSDLVCRLLLEKKKKKKNIKNRTLKKRSVVNKRKVARCLGMAQSKQSVMELRKYSTSHRSNRTVHKKTRVLVQPFPHYLSDELPDMLFSPA